MSTSYYTGGTDTGYCCHCGTRGTRDWHVASHPLKGHGPHARSETRVYDDEVEG